MTCSGEAGFPGSNLQLEKPGSPRPQTRTNEIPHERTEGNAAGPVVGERCAGVLPEPQHAALEHASARFPRYFPRRSTLPVLRHALQAERRRNDQGPLNLRASSRIFDTAERSGLRREPRRPLFLAATSHVALQSADAAADPVEHHAPAALPILKAQHLAPRAGQSGYRTLDAGRLPPNCNNAPARMV
jgi:hypothetical protein